MFHIEHTFLEERFGSTLKPMYQRFLFNMARYSGQNAGIPSANRDSIRQAKGEPGQAPVPTPTLETSWNSRHLLILSWIRSF